MIKYSPRIYCDMNNVMTINDIVKPCSVQITTITISFRGICINKLPLPTDVFDFVNTPILCINTTDIDDIEGSSSYSLKDIAKFSTIPCENISPSVFFGDEILNNTYVSRDFRTSCQLVPPLVINKHIHPFGMCNPKHQCYLNSVIQTFLIILRIFSHNLKFNSSTEGFLSKCLFETAHSVSNSLDVDTLKFRLVEYDTCYDGQNQQDGSECLLILIEGINKGSVPYSGSNDNNYTRVSLSDI